MTRLFKKSTNQSEKIDSTQFDDISVINKIFFFLLNIYN
jgi:hypothetical protein